MNSRRLPRWTHATKILAASTFTLSAFTALPLARVQAADPYDKTLEQRVEALERELNTLSNDDKGKNVTNSTEVPTFVRAAGKQVQELTISGDLRFRYKRQPFSFASPRGECHGIVTNRSWLSPAEAA